MTNHQRGGVGCRSYRLAIQISMAALAVMLAAGLVSAAAKADTIVACEKVELPGKAHTLNPFDPPAKQRQETIRICSQVEVPPHNRLAPITDPKHDPRAWASLPRAHANQPRRA